MLRKPYVAGSFYPSNKDELMKLLNTFDKHIKVKKYGDIKAVISPHAGYIYSGFVAAHSFKVLKENHSGNKFILMGPSHYYAFENAYTSDYEAWQTPLGLVKSNPIKEVKVNNSAFIPEHSLEVQLPFLQYYFKNPEIYPILISMLKDVDKIARIVEKYNLPIIVSSDLSHYHPYEEAIEIDTKTIENILSYDTSFLDACGRESIKVLLHIAKKQHWFSELVNYMNSGDVASKDSVVGYASIVFYGD